jgi:hypothetical protein
MEEINIPQYDCQVKKIEGELYIFDPIRRKNLVLTPEEWVRQHFLRYLLEEFNYPKGLMRTEGGLKYEQRQKRSDILAYNRLGSPFFLVECKASHIPLTLETLEQACQYNYAIKATYLAITNGLEYAAFKFLSSEQKYIPWQGIPEFEKI